MYLNILGLDIRTCCSGIGYTHMYVHSNTLTTSSATFQCRRASGKILYTFSLLSNPVCMCISSYDSHMWEGGWNGGEHHMYMNVHVLYLVFTFNIKFELSDIFPCTRVLWTVSPIRLDIHTYMYIASTLHNYVHPKVYVHAGTLPTKL